MSEDLIGGGRSIPPDSRSWADRHTELEQANTVKVQRLIALGLKEETLAGHLIPARIEALVSVLPTNIRQELELRYEQAVGVVLDQLYEQTLPRLHLP